MDTNTFISRYGGPRGTGAMRRKQSVNPLILVPVLIGLLVISSGCVVMTEAASDQQQDRAGNVSALTGGSGELSAARLVAQGTTVLHFDPSPGQMAVGDVLAVQIRLENVENLYGIEVHLGFDKDVLQVEDDDPGREGVQIALGQIPFPDFIVQNMVDNFGGRLDYAVVQLSPRPPASGSGVVATIRFRALQPGTSPLHFTHVKLASPDGFSIPVTLQDGAVVVSAGAEATATPTTVPRPTLPGPTATQPSGERPTATPTATSTPIPVGTATPTAPTVVSCPVIYVVRSGDTAYSITRRYGISLQALAAANNLSPSFNIRIGQLLVIPGVPGPTGTYHVVGPGETLYSIARHYGTSVETLAALNRIPHPWNAPLGKTLLICPP